MMENHMEQMNNALSKAAANPNMSLEEQRKLLHELLLLKSELQIFMTQKAEFLIQHYSRSIAAAEKSSSEEVIQQESRSMTFTLSLTTDTFIFKGKRPLVVLFPDREVPVKTWKEVALCILRACDAACPAEMDALCGKVTGNQRFLLTNNAKSMYDPLPIRNNLFFEGRQDTEYLLKIIVKRILIPLRFPYHTIAIQYTAR